VQIHAPYDESAGTIFAVRWLIDIGVTRVVVGLPRPYPKNAVPWLAERIHRSGLMEKVVFAAILFGFLLRAVRFLRGRDEAEDSLDVYREKPGGLVEL